MTLRRTLTTVSLLVAAIGLAGELGCGGLGVSAAFSTSDQTPSNGGASGDNDAGAFAPPPSLADAGTTPGNPSFLGNPLCKVASSGSGSSSTCNPQDDNTVRANGADAKCRGLLDAGAPTAVDAGDIDGGAPPPDTTTYACHVQENITGTEVAPVCLPEGSSTGPCAESQACKAGFECTGAQTGECRRYCCDPTACDATAFCDVQRIHGMEKVTVPVCMPIVACQLLTAGQCPGQACGIVDDASGLETASCIDIGPRGEGDDCETDHCAKDLACLGSQGSRKCFRLCETKGTSYGCAMGQTCKTNGVTFKDGNVGICSI